MVENNSGGGVKLPNISATNLGNNMSSDQAYANGEMSQPRNDARS